MIFVTVGTHEQPFNRLVSYMDNWASEHNEKVIIQTGYSTYAPTYCEYEKMYLYEQMQKYIKDARIVITHGGPSSFVPILMHGKKVIVVPRQEQFGEHVNDHQSLFCDSFAEMYDGIIVVKNIYDLDETIKQFDSSAFYKTERFESTNSEFCEKLERIIDEVVGVPCCDQNADKANLKLPA